MGIGYLVTVLLDVRNKLLKRCVREVSISWAAALSQRIMRSHRTAQGALQQTPGISISHLTKFSLSLSNDD